MFDRGLYEHILGVLIARCTILELIKKRKKFALGVVLTGRLECTKCHHRVHLSDHKVI